MSVKNLSVKAKLALTFGALAVLLLTVATLCLVALSRANQQFSGYVNGLNARAIVAEHVRTAVDRRAIAARNLVLVTRPADVEAEKQAVTKAHEDVGSGIAHLGEMLAAASDASPQAHELFGRIQSVEARYGPVALAIVKLALEGQRDQAVVDIVEKCRPLLNELVAASTAYAEFTEVRARELTSAATARFETQRYLLVGFCSFAVLVAVVAGYVLTRSLTRALDEAVDVADHIAQGDLSQRIAVHGNDETGRLLQALKNMQHNLGETVRSVRDNAEAVASASTQIAQGNHDLSHRTEQQASALQQTASSMEQLGSAVRHNADNAQAANQLAGQASSVAAQGGEVVEQVVVTMKDIQLSSSKIGDIIGVIDGIAFQTNILALNAAVEAARAGEQGRGFAVVASEVRGLASRSAEAAREIKALILASMDQVARGTELVGHAGTTMHDVIAAIQRVSDLMSEISAASREQSDGVRQVGDAVTLMDQATQQNAALVEQSAAAASSLQNQARQLVQAVAIFKQGGESRAPGLLAIGAPA